MQKILRDARDERPIGHMQIYTIGGEEWHDSAKNLGPEYRPKIEYVSFVGISQGIGLGTKPFWGFAAHDRLYNCSAFFFNGTILQYSLVKDKKITPLIPEIILHIVGQDQARVNATASVFDLPLEDIVSPDPIVMSDLVDHAVLWKTKT